MFDSPTQFCPRCKQWVALDRSQQACAQTYACECVARGCPLSTYFRRELAVAPEGAAVVAALSQPRAAG